MNAMSKLPTTRRCSYAGKSVTDSSRRLQSLDLLQPSWLSLTCVDALFEFGQLEAWHFSVVQMHHFDLKSTTIAQVTLQNSLYMPSYVSSAP